MRCKGLLIPILLWLPFVTEIHLLHAYPVSRSLELTAQRVEVLQGGKKVYAEGDVIVEREGYLLYAGSLTYEPGTEILELSHFKLFDLTQNATILGDKAQLDLRNGEIWSARVFIYYKKEGFRIKAWNFSKNALNEYYAQRALITTCDMDCEKEEFPPWSVEVKNIILTPEGISMVDATTFRAGKVPLLYLPKKMFLPKVSLPIFEPRKRGLLLPGITQGSRLGFGLQIPYFWPITDQIDFTIAPLYTTKRGLLWDIENQVALTDHIKGLFKVRYLRDTKRGEYATEEAPKDRYWFTGKIDVSTGRNWDLHLDLDILSDKDFLEEFNVGEGGFDKVKNLYLDRFSRDVDDKAQDYRTSSLWLQSFRDSLYTRLQSSYLDYQGKGDKKEILQPLAGLHLSLLPFQFKGLIPALNLDYNYFYREKNYYGNRLGLNLEVSYPFSFQFLKSEAKVNYKNFLYLLEDPGNLTDKSLQANLFEASFTTYTLLYRNFGQREGPLGFQFQHILKPYLTFFYRKKLHGDELPTFVYEDYLTEKTKAIEYGLWQYFNLPGQKNFFVLRAYQQYDLNRAERSVASTRPEKRAFSDLFIQAFSSWKDRLSLRYDTSYNFYGLGFKKHSLNLSLRKVLLDSIDLTYQEDKAWDTRQVTLRLGELLKEKFFLSYYISRNLKAEETSEQKIETLYLQDCYLLGLGISITPRDTKFYFRVDLKGLGGLGEKAPYQP